MNQLINDKAENALATFPDDSVDMVFTSPPYAEQRKDTYGGTPADEYVEWFLPIARELYRILKPTGSFFLNIKPHVEDGETHLYVNDLVCALKREVGFKYIDEFSWVKNPFPGNYIGRFKNGFEPVYHFTKGAPKDIKFNPLACSTNVKHESFLRATRKETGNPANGSGMTKMSNANILKLTQSRPSNVIFVNSEMNQYDDRNWHPATFPKELARFFIKSFTDEGDIVLDPFGGSGTVLFESMEMSRHSIYIERSVEFFSKVESKYKKESTKPDLFI